MQHKPITSLVIILICAMGTMQTARAQVSDVSDAGYRIVMPEVSVAGQIDMGQVRVAGEKDSIVAAYLRNTGTVPIRIDSIIVSAPFTVVTGSVPFSIPEGGKRKVHFLFRPAEAGVFASPVLVASQLSKAVTGSIRGEGVSPDMAVDIDLVDFGRIRVLTLKDTSVAAIVRNVGSGTLRISGVAMLGPDDEQFAVVEGGGAFSLGAGESRSMQLRFAPTTPGRSSGRLGLYHDGPGSPAVVDLFGEAEAEAIVASVRVVEASEGVPVPRVTVEEYLSTQYRPMLNYVFFGENTSVLERRYAALTPEEVDGFSINGLHQKGTLEAYHSVLDIVGRRLRDHPSASIIITGCNAHIGQEKDNTALSRARAETVSAYLQRVWRIAEHRIRLEARNLPSRPSNSEHPDGAAENRRAELRSDTWEILAPIATRDYERNMHPSVLRFHTDVNRGARVATWSLALRQEGATLKTIDGSGPVPEQIDWRAVDDPEFIPQSTGTLAFTLTIGDGRGQVVTADGALRVEHRKVDKEVGRYSLILFDFDQAALNPYNRRIAAEIREALPSGADIAISGYTDRIGDEEYNRKLSEDRARNAAQALGLGNVPVRGLGKSVELYDNDLPEGRFYSRTVNILVEQESGR